MAHELSHVLLDSVGHPLRRQEEAVDLTAMLHGYSRFFTAKSQHRIEWSLPEANSLWSRIKALLLKEDGPGLSVIKERSWVGYLSPDEIRFAQSLMR